MKFLATFLLCALHLTASTFTHSFIGDLVDSDLDVAYNYYQDTWMMGLSDGSSWKLLPMTEKRKQTWTEWWNKTDPKEWKLSDDFFFDPATWKGHFHIQVYKARDTISNNYTYILVNKNTDQKVFAEFIPYGAHFVPKMDYAMKMIENADTTTSTISVTLPVLGNVTVLNDQTIWTLNLVEENSRSFSQWWNNVEIDQPDKIFLSKISEWKTGDAVKIYHTRSADSELYRKYKGANSIQEVYLVENKTRNKIAYASLKNQKDLILDLITYAKNQEDKAYSKGYSEGYHTGYNDGKVKGLSEGLEKLKKRP